MWSFPVAHPAFQHHDPAQGAARDARARPRENIRLRGDGLRPLPPGPRPRRHRFRRHPPLPELPGPASHFRLQFHRHRRQDHCPRQPPEDFDRRTDRGVHPGILQGHGRPRRPAGGHISPGDRTYSRYDRDDPPPGGKGNRLPGRERGCLLRHLEIRGIRKAFQAQHRGSGVRLPDRARRGQKKPSGFRPLESLEAGRAVLGEPLGGWAPGMAY